MESKKQLRIAMLGHKRIPSREGGIEIVVEEISVRMVQQGHQVTCYNRNGPHVSGLEFSRNSEKEYKGIKLKSVFTINRRGVAAMTASVAATIQAALGKYDVVHFHAEGSCAILWLAKLFGKRCIVTVHGLDHQRDKWGKIARLYIMVGEKCAVKYADEIIVLSENMKRYFWNTYKRKTRVIPNGVNKSEIRRANIIKQKFNLDKDDYILFLGRLVPEKGISYLIQAFKNVITDKKLVIAGGSSDTDSFVKELKTIAKDNERIIFTGFVQGEELDELYSNAYVYVLPSNLEGMPLSLMEAMSYGNCCLISNIDECISVAEDRVIAFKKGSVDDLREKLQMICNDKELVEYYKKDIADFICEKYRWDDIVDKILKLYQMRKTKK